MQDAVAALAGIGLIAVAVLMFARPRTAADLMSRSPTKLWTRIVERVYSKSTILLMATGTGLGGLLLLVFGATGSLVG